MFNIRAIQKDDWHSWCHLYKKYLDFYKTSLIQEQLYTVWDWIFDHKIYCYVATQENNLVGLVHFREFLRPIKATAGVFMDDLYVEPECRGQGIGQALIKWVETFAQRREIPVIRWITHAENHQAMKMYDKVASRTQWVTYDLIVEPQV